MKTPQRTIAISHFQAEYLLELVNDDLELTVLEHNEVTAAESLITKLEDVIERFDQ